MHHCSEMWPRSKLFANLQKTSIVNINACCKWSLNVPKTVTNETPWVQDYYATYSICKDTETKSVYMAKGFHLAQSNFDQMYILQTSLTVSEKVPHFFPLNNSTLTMVSWWHWLVFHGRNFVIPATHVTEFQVHGTSNGVIFLPSRVSSVIWQCFRNTPSFHGIHDTCVDSSMWWVFGKIKLCQLTIFTFLLSANMTTWVLVLALVKLNSYEGGEIFRTDKPIHFHGVIVSTRWMQFYVWTHTVFTAQI